MRALTMDELKFVSGGSDVVEKVNVTAKRKPSDPSNPFPSIGTQTETVTVPSRKGNTLDLDFDATSIAQLLTASSAAPSLGLHPHPEPEPEIIIPSVTKNDNDLSIEKNDENKTEEIPDDWDTI